MNNIFRLIVVSVFVLNTWSCSEDFLDEDLSTKYATNYFESEEGLNDLAVSLYGNIRYHFAYDWAFGFTNTGVDEFSIGTDLTAEMWNNYDSRLAAYIDEAAAANKNYPAPEYLWDQMYFGISAANLLISEGGKYDSEDVKTYMGEGYLLRGYNYLRLVEQYGGVVLNTEPIRTVVRNFTRSSAEDVLKLIVSDLENAYNLLTEDEFRGKGTFTRPLAAHLLAKAKLFRCSERNDDWNTAYKEADLSDIITYADYVISARPLAADYGDLWDWTGIDCEAEMLPEILMSAQFNADASAEGRYGNRTNAYGTCRITEMGDFIVRTLNAGLDYQRLRTTEYTCNVYNREGDSRFWKSFKTKWNVNKPGSVIVAGDTNYLDGDDLAVIFLVNDKDDTRFNVDSMGPGSNHFVNTATGNVVPHAFPNYAGGNWVGQNWGNQFFVSMSKLTDGSLNDLGDYGMRDGVLARTGETYLIKAEALVRQGKYQEAIGVVNDLRARAQFKEGDIREHYNDGLKAANGGLDEPANGYVNLNSYYESLNIPYTTSASDLQIASYTSLPEEDEAILSKLGVSGDYDRMLHFILNERTRELCGEFLRWADLSRTETLLPRAKAFNAETQANLQEYHLLRPIPQTFIDGLLLDDGSNLSEEDQRALQNPGY